MSMSHLAPHSSAGVVRLRADGPKRFAVGFAVSPSSLASCAENGSAGITTYVYDWNGSKMSVVSGSLPSPEGDRRHHHLAPLASKLASSGSSELIPRRPLPPRSERPLSVLARDRWRGTYP